MTVQIINYLAVEPDIVIDPNWTTNITNKCGADALNNAFAELSLNQTGTVTLAFGALYGLILQSAKFEGQKNIRAPYQHRKKKAAARLVVTLLVCAPIMLLYLLSSDRIANKWLLLTFKVFLPVLIASFLLFGVTD